MKAIREGLPSRKREKLIIIFDKKVRLIIWHDLRHTYATLLDQNNMNMKVVSEILGHYSEEFTNEVYVIHKPEVIIYDTSEVMNSFIESLKLDSTERTIPVYDISFIQEYLF